jgi:hypothetical protein
MKTLTLAHTEIVSRCIPRGVLGCGLVLGHTAQIYHPHVPSVKYQKQTQISSLDTAIPDSPDAGLNPDNEG